MNVPSVSVEEANQILKENKDNVILLDVRTPGENAMSKIADTTLIPLNELQSRVDELDKNKKILIYCATGNRSQIACHILQQAGFENCFDVRGGISAWSRAGFDIERGEGGNSFAHLFNF